MALSQPLAGAPLSRARRWALLFTVAAGLLLVTLDNSVLTLRCPPDRGTLGQCRPSAVDHQRLSAGDGRPAAGAGTLGDRIGHRRMFLIGLVMFGVASLAAAFADSAAQLIAARAFGGRCRSDDAGHVGADRPELPRRARTQHRHRDLGFSGHRRRGARTDHWRLAAAALLVGLGVLINVPVVVVAFVATLLLAPEGRATSRPWDLVSSVLALAALSGLVLAIKSLIATPPSYALGAGALVLAVISGAAFARRQQRPAFLAGTLSAVFTLFAMAGLQLVTTQRPAGGRFRCRRACWCRWRHWAACPVHSAAPGWPAPADLWWPGRRCTGRRRGSARRLGGGMAITGFGMGSAISVASTAILNNVPAHRAGIASSGRSVL